jgi:hypothetical protein
MIKTYISKCIPRVLFLSDPSDLVYLYLRSSLFGPCSYHEVSRHFVVGGGARCCFVPLDLLSVGSWGNGKSWVITFIDTVDNLLINLSYELLSDNQVTVACATLGKLCQISLLPLRTEQQNTLSEINTINLLNLIDEPKNACTIRDSYKPGCILKPDYYLLHKH